MTFSVKVAVRSYELDTQGHLNQAVYLQYAEHARWELLRAAGISSEKLLASGVGPVVLDTHMKFLRELRAGDEVSVTARLAFGEGKTFTFEQSILKEDGAVALELTATAGLLDLGTRRLIADPRTHLEGLAGNPGLLTG